MAWPFEIWVSISTCISGSAFIKDTKLENMDKPKLRAEEKENRSQTSVS